MKISFSDLEYSNRRKMTKRDLFFNFMNDNLPWKQWIHIVQPFYYNNSTGRKPRDIEIMLRMYLIQYWFQLSDEATEEAIIDSNSMRRFVGIDFFDNQVPDSTTLLRFRHTLENNNLHLIIIANFEECLRNHQYFFKHGNITDASIIHN